MSFAHGALTIDEVRELIWLAWQQAGVSLECELCKQGNWTIVHDGEHDGLGLPLRKGTASLPFGPSLMVYVIECTNCGNVRQFNKAKIEELAARWRRFLANLPTASQ